MADPDVLVACLCAQWCGVCRDYAGAFAQVAARFPQARFCWIDIEDQSELVDPVDVENFPTLLIALGESPAFFGTIPPHAGALERLVQECVQAGPTRVAAGHELPALVRRLRHRPD
jgi:thioredoxin 1